LVERGGVSAVDWAGEKAGREAIFDLLDLEVLGNVGLPTNFLFGGASRQM